MNTEPKNNLDKETSLRKIAVITGIGLLIMAVLAPIVHMNIFPSIIITGDAQTTAINLKASLFFFRIGILFFLIVAILDIIVAWGLYILVKPVNKNISLLAAWFRIIYAAILVVSLNNLLNIFQFTDNSIFLNVLDQNQANTQILYLFNSFQSLWDFSMILFSIHLLILGALMLMAKYIPKFLSILIIIAGIGYLIDGVGNILFVNYNFQIAMFTFIGEVIMIFWLFWKGIKGFKNI